VDVFVDVDDVVAGFVVDEVVVDEVVVDEVVVDEVVDTLVDVEELDKDTEVEVLELLLPQVPNAG
jgi:hypothetical protein